MMRSISVRAILRVGVGWLGGKVGFFQVADHDDIFVVEGVGWCGVIKAAGDDPSVVK